MIYNVYIIASIIMYCSMCPLWPSSLVVRQ